MVFCSTESQVKPVDRLISEALNIKNALETKEMVLMSAKTKFSRCVLPDITPNPTEQEKEHDEQMRKDIKKLKVVIKG